MGLFLGGLVSFWLGTIDACIVHIECDGWPMPMTIQDKWVYWIWSVISLTFSIFTNDKSSLWFKFVYWVWVIGTPFVSGLAYIAYRAL